MKINDSKSKDLKNNIREPSLIFKKDAVMIVKTPGRNKLNVRAAPDAHAFVIATVPYGDRLEVEWINEKEWVKVKTSNSVIGYCLLMYLDAI